jgi:PAS domain S-box-containing protein
MFFLKEIRSPQTELVHMKSSLNTKLEKLSKDAESFKELKEMFSDIFAQKNKYAKHLRLLERVIENDYDSIMITDVELEEPGPKIVYANEGFTNITGYDRDEVIGETPRILQGPKTDRATLDRLRRRLESGRPFFGQGINYRKDGSQFVNQWDIHPLVDDEGQLTHWVSYQHDISERKRAERRVFNTHTEFDDLREMSKSTLLDVNTDGEIISANKSFRNLTGYAKDEIEGKKIWDLMPRKYKNSLRTRFDKQFDETDFTNQKLKGIIKHKKGLPIQVEGISSVLELDNQTIVRAEIKNISLQKRIMETLQKRNANYSNIVDKATQFTYRITMQDGNPVIEYVSEEFPKVTGLPAKEVTKSGSWEQLIHDDDIEEVRKCLQHVMDGSSCTCEYRIRTGDGTYQKVVDYCKPGTVKDNGERNCVRGSISFKQAEKV